MSVFYECDRIDCIWITVCDFGASFAAPGVFAVAISERSLLRRRWLLDWVMECDRPFERGV